MVHMSRQTANPWRGKVVVFMSIDRTCDSMVLSSVRSDLVLSLALADWALVLRVFCGISGPTGQAERVTGVRGSKVWWIESTSESVEDDFEGIV